MKPVDALNRMEMLQVKEFVSTTEDRFVFYGFDELLTGDKNISINVSSFFNVIFQDK